MFSILNTCDKCSWENTSVCSDYITQMWVTTPQQWSWHNRITNTFGSLCKTIKGWSFIYLFMGRLSPMPSLQVSPLLVEEWHSSLPAMSVTLCGPSGHLIQSFPNGLLVHCTWMLTMVWRIRGGRAGEQAHPELTLQWHLLSWDWPWPWPWLFTLSIVSWRTGFQPHSHLA